MAKGEHQRRGAGRFLWGRGPVRVRTTRAVMPALCSTLCRPSLCLLCRLPRQAPGWILLRERRPAAAATVRPSVCPPGQTDGHHFAGRWIEVELGE